jgi:hypothetical protein
MRLGFPIRQRTIVHSDVVQTGHPFVGVRFYQMRQMELWEIRCNFSLLICLQPTLLPSNDRVASPAYIRALFVWHTFVLVSTCRWHPCRWLGRHRSLSSCNNVRNRLKWSPSMVAGRKSCSFCQTTVIRMSFKFLMVEQFIEWNSLEQISCLLIRGN